VLSLLAASVAHLDKSSAQPTPTASLPDTTYLAGETEPPLLGITLDQALRLADASSPVARASAAALRTARGSRMKEAAAFDPVLFGTGQRVSTDVPTTSPFEPSETRQRALGGGASWFSPIGTSVLLSLDQVQTETNAPFTTLPLERQAFARIEFVQPLLRGFGLAAARGELVAAERELEAAQRDYESATRDLHARTENAYWELFAAERNDRVQRLQRQRAAVFLGQQILRGETGVVGPGAVAIARTFLAEQEALVIETRLRLDAASDRLAEVMGLPPDPEARYHCVDEPPPPGEVEPLATALERAMRANPALASVEQQTEAAHARLRQAARNRWPDVQAFGGYGGSGLAGTGRQIVFGADTIGAVYDTDFGDAWGQVWDDDYPDWNVGLRVNLPLGWRADRGEYQRQLGFYERAQEIERAQRLALENAVRLAHRELESSQRALDAMREILRSAEEQARISRLEYQAGRTTAFEVVNLEADRVRAEFGVSGALVRVARAASEFRRLTFETGSVP
jgi:outer membrane protein TolC